MISEQLISQMSIVTNCTSVEYCNYPIKLPQTENWAQAREIQQAFSFKDDH